MGGHVQAAVNLIVHLCAREAWQAAQAEGIYRPESLAREGFIHFSRPEQVLAVANAFYRGVEGLVLLWVDPARLSAELRWEAPAPPAGAPAPHTGGETFPHLYGPLEVGAVVGVVDFPPGAEGVFRDVPAP